MFDLIFQNRMKGFWQFVSVHKCVLLDLDQAFKTLWIYPSEKFPSAVQNFILTSHALKLKRKKVKLAKTIFEQQKILKMINNPKQRNKTVSTTNISCFNLLFFNYFIMYHPKCGSLNIDPQ